MGNLVHDQIALQIAASIGSVDYKLLDIRGAIIAKGVLSAGQQTLEVSNLANGMYVLQLHQEQQALVYKIIKQ